MALGPLAATADLAFDGLVPVAQGKVLYVLEWNSEDSLDGMKEAFVIVVLKRAGGCLLAIPEGFLSVEDLKEGGEMGSVLGSSVSMVVNAMHVDGPSGLEIPVVIADVDQAIVGAMRHAEEVEETAMPFLPEDPFALPSGDELVAKSLAWLQNTTLDQQEGWYSQEVTAESEINTPKAPKARPSRAKATAAGDTGSGVAGKPKRQTTATLVASVQAMMDTLPALSLQMQEMMDRQLNMEEQLRNNQNPAAVLRQPLSSSLVTDPRLGASAKAFGSPPRTQKMSQALVPSRGGEPAKVQELASQKEETAPVDVTQAILAQSTALTSLVAALAGNQQDPMQDLQGATSGTRGALGRAKLQEELAQQRGTFFHSVVQQMSRRMMPTSPVDQPYAQLVQQGVTGTRYLERFGGYGKQRELADPISADDHAGLCHDGELGSREGHPGAPDRHGGAGLFGSGSLRPWSVADIAGGSPGLDFHKSPTFSGEPCKGLLAPGESAVGHSGPCIPKGAGHDRGEAWGDFGRKGFWKWRRGYSHRACKGERKSRGRGGARRAMTLSPPSVLSYIDETMTFVRWATCLPRWVLATRNDYAWHLARSFSVKWHGSAMRSAVFPLPVPFPGCFDGGGPWLSRSRMKVLAQKKVVHLIVVALNFMHLRRFATDFELRRFPNRAQQLCFRRLYSLVAACGYRPEPLPVVPGHAGAELTSCMDTLERFLAEHGVFRGGYCQGDRIPFVPRVEDEDEKARSFPQLRPYRALDVGRLRISGRGEWPLADYVDGVLWLPFVEPAVLRHDFDVADCPMPSFAGEKRDEYLRLARRWDELGLLRLHEADEDVGYCKIFNTWKNHEQDRQIGDRRSVNARERSISGPSAQLPCGTSLLNMSCQRGFCLRGSITLVQVTRSRSSTNLTPFGFSREELGGLSALEEFENAEKVGAFDRKVHGDRYGKEPMTRGLGAVLHPSFGALYQGDHLGVEFALAGHESLLRREGLLVEDQRLQTKRAPPLGSTWQGLIIDDYFVVSPQPSSFPMERSNAFLHLARARAAYEKHSLPGSTEKDVVAARTFKAAGAEVDSSPEVGSLGLCLVGSPLQKRLGLGLLSLRLAVLEGISSRLASRVSGSWVSVLLYRRCIGSVVEDLFALGAKYEEDGGDVIMPLTRRVSQELTFLAVLAPIAVSDLASSFSRRIFATDSSIEKGAIVETTLGGDVAKGLWLGGDRRGCYTKLQNPFRVLRKQVHPGLDEDLLEEGDEAEVEESPGAVVHRGTPFYFDFVEVCGGAGSVSHAMNLLGFSVAPTLDLSDSSHYDLKNHRLLEWIFHMLEEGRFRSVMCEPPRTTFSPAAHPAVRSYSCPKGFDRLLPKVLDGNILAFRSFCIVIVARRKRRPSLLEQPRLSKMCWLSIWKWLRENGFDEFVCASCMFKSKHRKEFRLLSYGLPAEDMDVRCCGGHFHVRIEGKYTRDSAMYTPELAMHFARGFARGLRKMRLEDAAGDVPGARRKESLLVNDILMACHWRVVRSWFWRGRSHINLLETGVVVSLQKQLLADGLSGRYVVLMDSSGALSKGRSSSRALQPLLQRSASIQLAGGQYFAYGFAPTSLRPAVRHSLFEVMSYEDLYHSHFVGLARFQANWVRLVLLSSLLPAVGASSPSHHHQSSSWTFPVISGFVLVTLMLSVWIFALRDFSGFSKNPKTDRFSGTFISFRGDRLGMFLAMVFVNCTLVAAPLVPETANEAEREGGNEFFWRLIALSFHEHGRTATSCWNSFLLGSGKSMVLGGKRSFLRSLLIQRRYRNGWCLMAGICMRRGSRTPSTVRLSMQFP